LSENLVLVNFVLKCKICGWKPILGKLSGKIENFSTHNLCRKLSLVCQEIATSVLLTYLVFNPQFYWRTSSRQVRFLSSKFTKMCAAEGGLQTLSLWVMRGLQRWNHPFLQFFLEKSGYRPNLSPFDSKKAK